MRSIVGCLHACIKTKGSQFARLISWISKYKFIERKNKRNLGIHGEFTPFIGIYISHVKRFAVKIKNRGKKKYRERSTFHKMFDLVVSFYP